MKGIIIFALLLAFVTSKLNQKFESKFVTAEAIEEVRKVAPFEVYSYEEHPFKDFTKSEIKQMFNTEIIKADKKLPRFKNFGVKSVADIPTHFHTQENWPDCRFEVRNQGHCGSCWAFAATEVLSDRFCISSSGTTKVVLSPQDLVSCDYLNFGCNGGNLGSAWFTLKWKGVVSEACLPYASAEGVSPSCTWFGFKCEDKAPVEKYYAKNYYTYTSIEEIKENMMTKGPIVTGFMVYEDFTHYKGGVYTRTSDELLGGHAIKVVGWGTEDNVDYWIGQNSWGADWAEKGYFRIKLGECEFEENMISGDPYY